MPTIEFTIDKIDKKINKAEKRGIEQGIRRERMETARRMLGANMPDADICKLTGLTPEELAQLKQKTKS